MARKVGPSIEHPTLEYLQYRGPHRVASGPLDPSGLRGLVYAPAYGRDLPVVAFGHGWLQPASRYTELFSFMASWGLVVVAPDTRKGPVPSHAGFATDLRTALGVAAAGRLGGGRVRVDPTRTGVMGHSLGGGAAVLAAAADRDISAVVTVTPAQTSPSAIVAAAAVRAPSLHLVGSKDAMAGSGTDSVGAELAAAWGGPTQVRTVKAGHLGLPEGAHWSTALMGSTGVTKVQRAARVLATGFFLRHLAGQEQLAADLEGDVKAAELLDLQD